MKSLETLLQFWLKSMYKFTRFNHIFFHKKEFIIITSLTVGYYSLSVLHSGKHSVLVMHQTKNYLWASILIRLTHDSHVPPSILRVSVWVCTLDPYQFTGQDFTSMQKNLSFFPESTSPPFGLCWHQILIIGMEVIGKWWSLEREHPIGYPRAGQEMDVKESNFLGKERRFRDISGLKTHSTAWYVHVSISSLRIPFLIHKCLSQHVIPREVKCSTHVPSLQHM